MTSRIPLFTILGFRVSLDYSLFLLAALLMFNLGSGYFPAVVEGIRPEAAYSLAAIGTLGMFASIVFHELSHSLVARRFGLPVGGITLFVFGGIAELQHEPRTPGSEFWIAIAGPIASFVLALFFYLIAAAGDGLLPHQAIALLNLLSIVNLMLGIFNMLPAFPLDGGRVLRSILWWRNGDALKSTRMAARLGTFLGYGVMALGIYEGVAGHNFIGGMWYLFIGFFITSAAAQSRLQAELVSSLRGVPLSRVMKENIGAVPAGATIQAAVTGFFDRFRRNSFPVIGDNGAVAGMLPLSAVSMVPRERWNDTLVRDVVKPLERRAVASPYDDAFDALMRMSGNGRPDELVVVYNGALAGSVDRRDLLEYHRMQMGGRGEEIPEG